MTIPVDAQIVQIKSLLESSIDELILNDSNIFNADVILPQNISPDAILLNRKLHETTINHRLAYYIENALHNTDLESYNVDIEYNRYYNNLKLLETVEGQINVRPDILVHSRINDQVNQQHYLVIEAKKNRITTHDINKIKGFISDDHYNYLFGLTVSYCRSTEFVLANLYYFNGHIIDNEAINRPK